MFVQTMHFGYASCLIIKPILKKIYAGKKEKES